MQGQDPPGVLASAALRTPSNSVDDVVAALTTAPRARLPMRGTVFLMPAADALWITDPCAKLSIRRDVAASGTARGCPRPGPELTVALDDGGLSRTDLFAGWDVAGISTADGAATTCCST